MHLTNKETLPTLDHVFSGIHTVDTYADHIMIMETRKRYADIVNNTDTKRGDQDAVRFLTNLLKELNYD